MLVNGSAHTSIWFDHSQHCVIIIDQTKLPHHFATLKLSTLAEFCQAITIMQVRGAPLIGVTAAFGLALAMSVNASEESLAQACQQLLATRPTAVNLRWAIDRVSASIKSLPPQQRAERALVEAELIRSQDIHHCEAIGDQGLQLLTRILANKPDPRSPLHILTHCNAGWLAAIDWGTALAPVYKAHQAGMNIHVWVDETRPRNQGASLTAWELTQQGVPHTVITDNTGGHLMQQGMVDACIVGSDRTTANGDVCNKIGTYLKALAARDNQLPFFVALPTSTIDWQLDNGLSQVPIEQRSAREVTHISGLDEAGNLTEVQLVANSSVANYAFDVTPARLVTGLITEHGVFAASGPGMNKLRLKLTNEQAVI